MGLNERVSKLETYAGVGDCQTCAARPVVTIVKEPGDKYAGEQRSDECPECKRTIKVISFTINPGNTAGVEA